MTSISNQLKFESLYEEAAIFEEVLRGGLRQRFPTAGPKGQRKYHEPKAIRSTATIINFKSFFFLDCYTRRCDHPTDTE